MGRPGGRERLITASLELIARDGFGGLTYDSLAQETGMTKGGVLYHFPSKDDLVRAVFTHALTTRRQDLEQHLPADQESPSRADRMTAYLDATIGQPPRPEELFLFVDALRVAELRQLWHESSMGTVEGSEFDTAGIDAQLMRFAADGLWMLESLGVVHPSPAHRQALINRATQLIRAEQAAQPETTSTPGQA